MKLPISKSISTGNQKGSISIMTAMITAVFVGALIVPLTVYNQNAQRSQVLTKQKYEALEYLEQTAKILQQKYVANPTSLASIGAGESLSKDFCITSGAGREICARKISLMATGQKRAIDPNYTDAKDVNGITVVASYSSGSQGNDSEYVTAPVTTVPIRTQPVEPPPGLTPPGTPPSQTPPIRIPTSQPTQQPVKPSPKPNPDYPNQPGKTPNSDFNRSAEYNAEPTSKDRLVELVLPSEMFQLSTEEKIFFAIEKVLPDFLKSEETEFDGSFIHLASALGDHPPSPGGPSSGPKQQTSMSTGENGMAIIPSTSSYANQVSFTYAWDNTNRDVQIDCKLPAYNCVEVKICPPQYVDAPNCSDNKYYTQQVVFYGETL